LRVGFPEVGARAAAGLVAGGFDSGCGSEIGGFDDEISRDHNWGPRFFLFLREEDKRKVGAALQEFLDEKLPAEFAGYRNTATTLPKNRAYVTTPEENLRAVLALDRPPEADLEWMRLPELRLFEYTAGVIFHEPTPLISPLRARFAYYPDNVWLKRLSYAFFHLHAAGNVARMARRGDAVAARFYLTALLKAAMRICFLLRRRYAPYHKWLFRALQALPDLPPELPERIRRLSLACDLASIEGEMYALLDLVGEMANASGIIKPLPLRKTSPFIWTNFNQYGFMEAFHAKISGTLREKPPYEGPLDLDLAVDCALRQETMRAAWEHP
jgi:hypothetical protein